MNRFRGGRRGIAVLGAAVLAAGLLTNGQAGASGVLGTNGAPVPELQWGPCPAGTPERYECAEAEVPLSYRSPRGPAITLAVGRLPAADQANKLGTIFYNPGGPGGSGRIPPELTPGLHERFDIVGFDPRGVAASTPLRCFESSEQAELLGGPFPVTLAEQRQRIRDTARASALCARNAGPLLDHMSTANVARDMDLLRQAVGEERTSYYGISYGSHLGSVYANIFPERVGSLVIDAVLDPVEWTTGYRPGERFHPFSYRLGSFEGSRRALEAFFAACAAEVSCAFREPGADLAAKFDTLLDRLRKEPATITLPGGEGETEVTYQQFIGFTLGALYGAESSPVLAEFLQAVDDATDPAVRLQSPPVAALPPAAPSPGFQQDVYVGPEQGIGVFCADSDNPGNPWAWGHFARKADRKARGFGSQWTWLSLPCATWPGADRDRYTGPWNRRTPNPVLVIGNGQGDPATPYEDAVRTSRLLGDARLLTLDSFGHGARGESACIDAALDAYFVEGDLPPEGTVCEPDRGPFDAPAPTS
ncbi:alpha/beta hydrolase [Qaidamihabitans albus]|uniref:alpha/beta hydrolase n=1 Tax=Qaidamihabitans albus TaxID=2795733 RepID=UPI0027DCDC0B|nr:alpha/beta hydrolase [Qaidamihabitans albus]